MFGGVRAFSVAALAGLTMEGGQELGLIKVLPFLTPA